MYLSYLSETLLREAMTFLHLLNTFLFFVVVPKSGEFRMPSMEWHSEDGGEGEHDSGKEQLKDTDLKKHVESKLFYVSASRSPI